MTLTEKYRRMLERFKQLRKVKPIPEKYKIALENSINRK